MDTEHPYCPDEDGRCLKGMDETCPGIARQMEAVKCIRREYHGGAEDVTWAEFAEIVVQDYDCARDVAASMLASDLDYEWNADEPEFYETFTVIDRDALEFCIAPCLARTRTTRA